MRCIQTEIPMPGGYKRRVDVCRTSSLPYNVKGATNKRDLILINEYLEDLNVSDPDLYVWIHERNHMQHPEKGEFKIRRMSDKEYYQKTGERINTALDYLNYLNSSRNSIVTRESD